MAKLIANLINETMTAAQIAQFQTGIQMAVNALPKRPIISNEIYDKIPKKGETRRKWAEQLLQIARLFPDFLPTTLKIEDVERDNILNGQLNQLHQFHLRQLVELLEFLLGLSGGEELNALSRFIENARTAANDGQPNGIAALNMINNAEGNAMGRTKTKKTKVVK
jgi:hypothetical protein